MQKTPLEIFLDGLEHGFGPEAMKAKALLEAAPYLFETLTVIDGKLDQIFNYELPEDVDGLLRNISDEVETAIAKAKGE